MSKKLIIAVTFITILISCAKENTFGNPEVDPTLIQKDYLQWWTYYYNTIILSSDFKPIDENSQIISKKNFLKKLTTGNYLPFRLKSNETTEFYQLYPLDSNGNSDIKKTIISESTASYQNFEREGKQFPKFNFTDVKGTIFNKETLKNKIIVLKCWFIHCQKCLEEMPDLNALKKKYAYRKDIVFISLAEEGSQTLTAFLLKKKFDYAVVPNQKFFMRDTLKITEFPTHYIINKNGQISKKVSRYKELAMALQSETSR